MNQDDDDIDIVIKDLDSGETYHEESTIEVLLSQYTTTTSSTSGKWKEFWDNVQDLQFQLLDACESGKVEVVYKLLQDKLQMKEQFDNARLSQTASFIQQEQFQGLLDINAKALDDWTALHYAVNNRNIEIAQILLEAGADANSPTKMGTTPLHLACLRHCIELVQLLIQYKVDINCYDSQRNTPLHMAAESGDEDILDFLLKNGANANQKNQKQCIPLDVTGYSTIRTILKKYSQSDNDYQRTEIGGIVVPNSRADHVQKLLQVQQQPFQRKNSSSSKPIQVQKVDIKLTSPDAYIFHKLLGKGSFGEVYLASRKSDKELFAIKTLNKDKVFSKNLTRYAQTEKNVLSVMRHPFIVKLHAAFQNNEKLFMVLDFCPGGDLGNLLTKYQKLEEKHARFYISEILLALEALHKQSIIFRDLKPDNVVLDERGHARLTDFGLSKEGINNNITKSFCGSIAYLAPEVLMKKGHSRTVDWYLLGVLLYEMLVGIPPYYNQNREQLFENIKKGPLRIPKNMSEDAKDLIKKLLNRDPAQRLGVVNDAQDIKSHPFFSSVKWTDLENKVQDGPFIEHKNPSQYLNDVINISYEGDKQHQRISDWSFIQN
ncbi:hypothetical protein pb186bvf_005392 [Paramecium bursaria]